ncbi:Pyroglutamyl-peptidase 1, partial [Halocaridina rubra]
KVCVWIVQGVSKDDTQLPRNLNFVKKYPIISDMVDAPEVSSEGTKTVPKIYVTGFKPFRPHRENASELAVQSLNIRKVEQELTVRVHTDILPVEYINAGTRILKSRKELSPKLTVHVGQGNVEKLKLESRAKNKGYILHDEVRHTPPGEICLPGGEDVIESSIDMNVVAEAMNKKTHLNLQCAASRDPGNFVCGFVYYLSLNEDKSSTAFIHVPSQDNSSIKDTTDALEEAIITLYQQLMQGNSL